MRREALADEVLQCALLELRPRDHVRPRHGQPVLLCSDDRALDHLGVRDEAVLDLGRRNPNAADFDQVVDAPPIPEEAVVVALEEIAGADRVAVERARSLLLVAPVVERRRVASDEDLTVVAELQLVAEKILEPTWPGRFEM